MQSPARRISRPRAAAFLIAAGAALRLLWLARPSLWSDEASTYLLARLPLSELLARLPRLESTPPLHFVLMHFWLRVLPPGPAALRLFSWGCGVASLWLFWRLARRLAPRQALWALALAAGCASLVHASQDGRGYALVLLLSLACALLGWRLARRPTAGTAAAYAALGACGMLTHYFFGLSVAADAVFLAWRGTRRKRGLQAAAFLGPAAACAAVAGQLLRQRGAFADSALIWEPMTVRHALEILGTLLADPWYLGLALTFALAVVGAACAAAIVFSARWQWRRRPSAAAFCWLHLALPFVLVRVAELAAGAAVAQERYVITAAPYLLLLLVGACAAAPGRAIKALLGLLLAAVAAAGLGGYLYCAARVDPRLAELAAAVRRATPPDEPVVHLNPFYYLPLRFYYLPERKHYYVKRGGKTFLIPALPGYDGLITPPQLPSLGKECVVVDPDGELFPRKLGAAPCAELGMRLGPR